MTGNAEIALRLTEALLARVAIPAPPGGDPSELAKAARGAAKVAVTVYIEILGTLADVELKVLQEERRGT